MSLSLPHIILLLLVVLILFGAGKLPKVMGDLGKGMKAFKKGMNDEDDSVVIIPPEKDNINKQ